MSQISKRIKKSINKAVTADAPKTPKLPPPAVTDDDIAKRELGKKPHRVAGGYEKITVTGSTGKQFEIAVPASYVSHIPKTWEWDETRFKVAEAVAAGIPLKQIADDPNYNVKHRLTIYGWLEHPEFRKHVDGLITETGFASQRERIAGMNRLVDKLFNKVMNELDNVNLNDKALGSILPAIRDGMKHLAQEKGEFVEQQNVVQQTTLNGAVGIGAINLERVLEKTSEDDRRKLEAEFDNMGDDIIRAITGGKD
jgi:hypothetical protein